MLDVLHCIIDVFGFLSIAFLFAIAFYAFGTYIGKVLTKQTKIKCLCKHEYEMDNIYHYPNGKRYEFECRKCGKLISVETVTDDNTCEWI